jgi:hypothetical protein
MEMICKRASLKISLVWKNKLHPSRPGLDTQVGKMARAASSRKDIQLERREHACFIPWLGRLGHRA